MSVTADRDAEQQRPIPQFLTHYTKTRYRDRLTPFSRVPAVRKMGDIWHVSAQRAPGELVITDRPCDIDPDGPTVRTYSEWADLVDRAASWLYAAGVRPWDRVAVVKSNHLDVALLGVAAARIGAIPCTLSGTYGPEVALVLLERLEKPFVVTDRAHIAKCGIDEDAVARLTTRTISVDGTDGRADIAHLDEFKGGPPAPVAMRAFEEPEVITHTSGTTGIPKLVMHSAESVWSMGILEAEKWPGWGLRRDDVVIFCDPYSHERLTTLQLTMATVTPRVIMLSDPLSPKVRELIDLHRPTVVEALPNIYLAWEPLARDPARLFRNVRLFINSFDAIHARTIRTFMAATDRRMPIWIESWSQSENGALLFRPFLRWSVRKSRAGKRNPPTQLLGWPVPGHAQLRATDPVTGAEVPRGQVGMIEIRLYGRCLAYVGEQDRHDLKVDGDWWNTGDLGIINKWGAVRLVDREVDRIEGGSAIELEDVLLDRLPETTEVVILPVAGGLPVPVVSTYDDAPLDPEAWRRATADLPPMDGPRHIRWEDFPRTGTWKIRRVHLREHTLHAKGIGIGRWT
ncbi:MAG: hypothetical protein AVDCRST_MAG41-4430 [uncultured Corynebacteriales bacterium]|uniref:AMP-dependent synthetase/ligase domain-containing protein n=1 Tax=uncultured Mycobacteriales bacterium TaxID=581187 RepID=A0A6J4JZQ9_9ACTN|nr:MAG: hypothetical protein AVDCRST_MAG41-4430 [uncultured Corynebacteriales bacterium]